MEPMDETPSGEATSGEKMIFIVEDDVGVGKMLLSAVALLSSYRAILLSSGLQALELSRRVKPDLLLLDYRLPDMNGLDLYERLHQEQDLATVPAILLSATLPPLGQRKGELACLRKPVRLNE